MPDPVVNPNPVPQQAATALRDVTLVLAAVPTVLAILGRHDFLGLVRFLSSVDGAPLLGALVTVGIFIWRQVIARQQVARKVTLALTDPADVTIKGEPSNGS